MGEKLHRYDSRNLRNQGGVRDPTAQQKDGVDHNGQSRSTATD
jgi:hypothetical protein